jgi:RNA polymerase sigma-70 factor (ECF subfamily)
VTDASDSITGGASHATSASLLKRARANDRAAWDHIVRLYSPLVYDWCRKYGLSHEDRLEIGQDVLRSVFLQLDEFRRDGPGQSFRRWLKTITQRRAIDFLRRAGRQPLARGGSEMRSALGQLPAPGSPSAGEGDDPAEEVQERKLLLRRALDLVRDEFAPRTWDAFWRVVVDEMAPADVAEALGVSVNVVYLSRSRVLRRLADQFGEVIDGWQNN